MIKKMRMLIIEYLYSKAVKAMLKCDVVICKAIYLSIKPVRCYPGKFFVKGTEIINFR